MCMNELVCVLPVLKHAQRLKEAVGFPVLLLSVLDTESLAETGAGCQY